jgi:hypothetical protein
LSSEEALLAVRMLPWVLVESQSAWRADWLVLAGIPAHRRLAGATSALQQAIASKPNADGWRLRTAGVTTPAVKIHTTSASIPTLALTKTATAPISATINRPSITMPALFAAIQRPLQRGATPRNSFKRWLTFFAILQESFCPLNTEDVGFGRKTLGLKGG